MKKSKQKKKAKKKGKKKKGKKKKQKRETKKKRLNSIETLNMESPVFCVCVLKAACELING